MPKMTIDPRLTATLPAAEIADEVCRQLHEHATLVVTAPPGAGKSTLLPLVLLQDVPEGRILMLEPRRLAARQIAERMAQMIGEEVGQTVGYRVRFDRRTSAQTRLEVLTEGILTRMLVDDPTLEGVSAIIFDEYHERSLQSDLALALTREAQQILRPDLRIVIMSATLDTTAICQMLEAPLVESRGRMFPVSLVRSHDEANAQNVVEVTARAICLAHREHEGDILVFLPGQGEIMRCQEMLAGALGDTHICPLYGLLSPQEQRRAILPSPAGERKVVLATSIAETSLTIEGVRIVIDSGLCRTLVHDPRNGLNRLETVRISRDMATQRMGRAGRVAEGVCYQLWSLGTEHRMAECRTPEIEEADLAPMMLDIAAWGESRVEELPWLTTPPKGHVGQARELLTLLGATTAEGLITPLGRRMAKMPCHPRIAKMLIEAGSTAEKALAADIAALLEERDPMGDNTDSSILARITLLRDLRRQKRNGRHQHLLHIAQEYRRMVGVDEDNSIPEDTQAGALIALAYPERIARLDGPGRYRLASGGTATLQHDDSLAGHEWIAIASMNAASGRVFLAAPLQLEDVRLMATTRDTVAWDNKQGALLARREQRVGTLVVESKPLQNASREEMKAVLCQAVSRQGASLLDWNDDVAALQRRVASVALWHPEMEIPDLSAEALLERTEEWLPLYLEQDGRLRCTAGELRRIPLTEVLWGMLDYNLQQTIDRLAPTHIAVPTGSRIRVDYRQGAEAPVLCVRLQECFGLVDTPRVDEGRRPVLMELLSPGFKPVQLTQDLANFWRETYFEVRKELRCRYPKHYWPDNPLEAEATRGVKKNS